MTRRSPFAGLSPTSFAFKGRPRLTARPSLFVEGFPRPGFAPTRASRHREARSDPEDKHSYAK